MKQVLLGIIMLGLLGGCQMGQEDSQGYGGQQEEEETVDVRALQDEYTRDHLVSTEQTEDGFYTMEGDSGKFRMLFPEDAVLSQDMHRLEKGVGEDMRFTDPVEGENRRYFVSIRYQDGISIEHSDRWVESFSDSVNFEGELEIKEDEDKRIYFGKSVYELEYTEGASHVYFAYIFSRQSDQALRMQYRVSCEGENCEEDMDFDREEAFSSKLMDSIEFQHS
ncbi:hypothetical protein HUG15_00390 [Salicibibacter cibarius]|uniref:Lipoprotein YvcA n=1 Tax=Salicibibacter cibarius TaxID=2743000 RepID=A0A7T6YZN7_9BACI|nr:hypothetical protein [Salicibibacter cibarius]QQK74227.1 hypothetical protein HUG15_00390 [Salicibibacter cibarius]